MLAWIPTAAPVCFLFEWVLVCHEASGLLVTELARWEEAALFGRAATGWAF